MESGFPPFALHCIALRRAFSLVEVDLESRGILILMKVGISTSTWFQVVPFCSLISEQLLFSLSDDFLRRL